MSIQKNKICFIFYLIIINIIFSIVYSLLDTLFESIKSTQKEIQILKYVKPKAFRFDNHASK